MSSIIKPEIEKRILQLEEKFKNSGQDLGSYLDGLLYDRYLTYWDYIHLDTLLSLQVPKTHFPDELIFITYHQATELYFKLILHEIQQIVDQKALSAEFYIKKLKRINRYATVLIHSFEVMIKGMEKEQFLQFRMSLLPASGFQSVQFRMIEIYATSMRNLVHEPLRESIDDDTSLEKVYEQLYWKFGSTNPDSGEKTVTLKQFEKRYTPRLLRIASQVESSNLNALYLGMSEEERNNRELISELKDFDKNFNVKWLLKHMGAAYRYLNQAETKVFATGGTNWKKYLPPSFQKIQFFPQLWDASENENWGKPEVLDSLSHSTV